MKKVLLISTLFFAVVALGVEEFNALFYEARRDRDAAKMLQLIQTIESRSDLSSNERLLTILADCYLEYGDWGVAKEQKEKTLEQARKYAEAALKLNSENGRANYIAGAAIGRLAQYKGIIQSLFMLGDFDKLRLKSIRRQPQGFIDVRSHDMYTSSVEILFLKKALTSSKVNPNSVNRSTSTHNFIFSVR